MSSSSSPLRLYKCLPMPKGDHNNVFDFTMLEMVVIHNCVIRSYNSVLYHSNRVEPGTTTFNSFLAYTALVNKTLHHHHDIEESTLFPFIESKCGGSMADNIAGHEAFGKHLKALDELVASLKASPELFNKGSFQNTVYALMDPLRDHLVAEVPTLRPERLRGAGITEAEMKEAQKKVGEYALKGLDVTTDAQIFIANGSASHAEWFPPVPKPALLLMKYGLWWVHSDMWAFACCDKNSVLKPEFAAYEPDTEE